MGARSRFITLIRLAPLLLTLALLAGGCTTNDPYDTLTDFGDHSKTVRGLFWPVLWVAIFVFFAVEGLLLFTMIRFRRRGGERQMPKQTHGNTRLEVGWTIVPSLVLAIIAVPTISTIVDLARTPQNALQVRVVARQWWFEFIYADPADPNRAVSVASEAHIPAGRPIHWTIESEDVIHSFWVPNLAGKQDAVPGKKNDLVFTARQPGVYHGECAEYCLDSHALMRFIVIAEPEGQFNTWLQGQAQSATARTTGSAGRGQELFLGNACIGCHAIEGSAAQGRTAPNLTHFGSRVSLAGNRLENTPENVVRWVTNPQQLKPGAKMPAFGGTLSEEDIKAIADYLHSLK